MTHKIVRGALLAAVVGLGLVLASPLANAENGSFQGQEPPEIAVQGEWLNSAKGALTLKALRGKAVVVEFWATWCPPCRETIPHLVELHEKHAKDGLVIASIHSPRGADKKDDIVAFAKENRMEYAIGLDVDGAVSKAYQIEGIPQAYVINPQGLVVWEGHPADAEAMTKAVEDALVGAKKDAGIAKIEGQSPKLDKAWRLIEKLDYKAAVKELQSIAKGSKDEKEKADAEGYLEDIRVLGEEKISQAESLLANKDFFEAASLLEEVAKGFAGLEVAKNAESKLKEWKKNSATKKEIDAGKLFADACKLEQGGKAVEAAALYKRVLQKYKGTAAAARAEERLKEIAAKA